MKYRACRPKPCMPSVDVCLCARAPHTAWASRQTHPQILQPLYIPTYILTLRFYVLRRYRPSDNLIIKTSKSLNTKHTYKHKIKFNIAHASIYILLKYHYQHRISGLTYLLYLILLKCVKIHLG